MPPPRVLVVDDDVDVRTALRNLLQARGFVVDVAEDGLEAIEILDGRPPPSAIVADLMMPGIVGNELLEYVAARRELAGIPIAIVTGSPQYAPIGLALFRKPVDAEALVEFLRSAIAR
ncbi:MAG TPA: response regulator [Kofleriaceae bacterium]|jgi:CheY-like chemotaxis protein|nr:response regulator [Kofleriaceae bacterium]